MGNTNNTNEQDTEFALCTVPENERKSYFSLTIVWTGIRICYYQYDGRWGIICRTEF